MLGASMRHSAAWRLRALYRRPCHPNYYPIQLGYLWIATSTTSTSSLPSQSLEPTSQTSLSPPNAKIRRASVEPSDQTSPASNPSARCTLPPTCCPPNRASIFGSALEMERHYAMFHTNVCDVPGCKSVFPDARFLELVSGHNGLLSNIVTHSLASTYAHVPHQHFLECHDPLTAVRQERGEKTVIIASSFGRMLTHLH